MQVPAFPLSPNRRLRAFRMGSLLLTGAALSLSAVAQNTAPPSAPTPDTIPVPVQRGNAADLPSLPAYDPNQTALSPAQAPPRTLPAAVQGPAPVVGSQPPTREQPFNARNAYDPYDVQHPDWLGSTYIPVDSWMYPALLRLYSLGYLDTAFISVRPWTRRSVLHMLEKSQDDIRFDNNEEALEILDKVEYALRDEPPMDGVRRRGLVYGLDSAYAGARVVGGTVLRDSYHLGQSFNNDYGRPYSNGFNSYNGFSTVSELGPFSLYFRGEYEHAPSYNGYSYAFANSISLFTDGIVYNGISANGFAAPIGGLNYPQRTIPQGVLPSQNTFRVQEAVFSAHAVGHEISFGKSDAWLGPGLGGAMSWSNNAENIYNFRINRVEPLHIPYVSAVVGNIRYDFMIGSLKGHTYPRAPYVHSEILSLSPTKNFQISFQRSIIFGGVGHEPVTLHTFLKGFFDVNDTTASEKYGRDDPGARFSSVTFSYRLPFLRKRVTLYTDSTTHDDIFPISAPRRAGWRPGIYFSQLPYAPKLDLRVEATYTDYVTSRSTNGSGNYYETIQRQGYTNNGFILGDWIGREAKGGQAWLTYHLSGNESIAVQYLRKKNGKDFVGGTTQNIFRVDVVKRFGRDLELNAWFQKELWKAPAWLAGQQGSTTGAFQVTWFPSLHNNHQ